MSAIYIVTYTCKGPVRGECGHTHRTLVGAARCLHRDQRACTLYTSLGGGAYSDRTIVRTDGEEMSELEMYKNRRHRVSSVGVMSLCLSG